MADGARMDVHRSFAQIAVVEGGVCRDEGRIGVKPEDLRAWAETLEPDDEVALEVTTNSDAIATMLRPLVARVLVSNTRKTRAISPNSAMALIRPSASSKPSHDASATAGAKTCSNHPVGRVCMTCVRYNQLESHRTLSTKHRADGWLLSPEQLICSSIWVTAGLSQSTTYEETG